MKDISLLATPVLAYRTNAYGFAMGFVAASNYQFILTPKVKREGK